MTTEQTESVVQDEVARHQEQLVHAQVSLRSMGQPNSVAEAFDFWDDRYEGRRLFSEVLGLSSLFWWPSVAASSMPDSPAPFHLAARVVAPALMVAGVILFMGAVSGAHLNPAVTLAFALEVTSLGSVFRHTSSLSSWGPVSVHSCCGGCSASSGPQV